MSELIIKYILNIFVVLGDWGLIFSSFLGVLGEEGEGGDL